MKLVTSMTLLKIKTYIKIICLKISILFFNYWPLNSTTNQNHHFLSKFSFLFVLLKFSCGRLHHSWCDTFVLLFEMKDVTQGVYSSDCKTIIVSYSGFWHFLLWYLKLTFNSCFISFFFLPMFILQANKKTRNRASIHIF